MRSRDSRAILTTLFSAWLPLSTAVLVSVIEHLPAPAAAQASRLPALIETSPGAKHVDQSLRNAVSGFKSSRSDPVVAYVSKMVAIPASELPHNKRRGGGTMTGEEARDLARKKRAEIEKARAATEGEATNGLQGLTEAVGEANLEDAPERSEPEKIENVDPEHLIGFARIYSGVLSVGDSVYVLTPKFSPANPHSKPEPQRVVVTGLYLMMGRGLEALESVPAGMVFGIAGLEGHILKSGTLCSQLEGGINLAGISMGAPPIVRVALEPVNPGDLEKMISGMRLLEQSDPCAQYEVLESGEHVILTAGELHLERCLKDLRERFARCEIQAGEPIVPYRESIVNAAEMTPPKDKDLPRGTVISTTTSKQITVRLRVWPLPPTVVDFLEKRVDLIRQLYSRQKAEAEGRLNADDSIDGELEQDDADELGATTGGLLSLVDFKDNLRTAFAEDKTHSDLWTDAVECIAAFGPRRVGPNILVDRTKTGACQKLYDLSDLPMENHTNFDQPPRIHRSRSPRPSNRHYRTRSKNRFDRPGFL